jgi:hypothetical protein
MQKTRVGFETPGDDRTNQHGPVLGRPGGQAFVQPSGRLEVGGHLKQIPSLSRRHYLSQGDPDVIAAVRSLHPAVFNSRQDQGCTE